MLIIAQVLKEKWLKITGFAHSRTTNKLVNEAANGLDRKKPPAVGTNQIAGFGGFCPLASLKKPKKFTSWIILPIHFLHIYCTSFCL